MAGGTDSQITGGSAPLSPVFSGPVNAPASTTSAPSVNIPIGTAPTSPVAGDEWYDSTQKALIIFINGVKQAITTCIFTATADKTVNNTTAETSIIGTGIGTITLPANFFVPGKTIRISGGGAYSTTTVAGNLAIKVKYGTTTLATGTISNLIGSATNLAFQFSNTITCRTVGATGTIITDGSGSYDSAGTLARSFIPLNNAGAAVTIDTTAITILDVTATFATLSASNTLKITNLRIEVLN